MTTRLVHASDILVCSWSRPFDGSYWEDIHPLHRDRWGMPTETRGRHLRWQGEAVWGWMLSPQHMGVIDLFDRLGARKHREWLEGGPVLSKRAETWLCAWGAEAFGSWDWGSLWTRGQRQNETKIRRFPPPGIRWALGVMGSKWWSDRMGLEDRFLRPAQFFIHERAKRVRHCGPDRDFRLRRVGLHGGNQVGFALELLREKEDSPITVKRFETFAARFWGEEHRKEAMGGIRERKCE